MDKIEYPVTLEEFKLYFLREAGLEYQPYPTFIKTTYDMGEKVNHNGTSWESFAQGNITEPGAVDSQWTELPEVGEYPDWVMPKSYQSGEKVVAVVNYKPGVWVSLIDDNYGVPGDSGDNWEEDEEDIGALDDVILDVDILRAMGEALFKFNKGLFSEAKGKIIFLYLSMFFLVYDRQMAASGMNGNSAAGPVIHRTVGKMSVTYMESKLYAKYPSYEFLSSNDYGRKAFNLMAPYLRGGLQILRGGSTGE